MLGRAVRRVMLASIFVAFSGTSAGAQASGQEGAQGDAVREIVAAFKQHPIVIIGEAHWLRQPGDFYVRLVGDPEFQETVQDIVIEFASRNNQPLLDRYSAGQNVPIEEVRRIWQDTTKVASWESPVYAEWLAAIREVNKTLPAARRLRVLAGDTAIDWSQIKTHDDWAALGDNNISIADVVIHEVLEKKHRALVVLGSNHVTRSGDRNGNDNTTTRIESRCPGSTYVAMMLHVGALNPALEDQLGLARRNAPALYALAGTPQGKMRDQNGPTLIEKADALLYLGPRAGFTLAMPPAGSLEPAYLREIDRRSMIEWGELRARKFLGAAAQ
jgi:hypothetical protein